MAKNLILPSFHSRLHQASSKLSTTLIQNHVCISARSSASTATANAAITSSEKQQRQHYSQKKDIGAQPSGRGKQLYASSKQQIFKYSNVAEAAYQNNNSENRAQQLARTKKSSDNPSQQSSSESRARLTNIRYFYADSEIDKACEKPLIRLNPMTMMYMGVSDDNSHLLQSANYLRNELPIRLAHMIKELRSLPFIVAVNPSMLDIHERCIKAFHDFENFEKDIKEISTEREFNQLVFNMLEMNKDLLVLLCDGFRDSRRYIKGESFVRTTLNKILSMRLGIRLLCEHHIALNKQSNLNSVLLPSEDQADDQLSANVDHFESKYVQTNGNGNDKQLDRRQANWVGVINKKFSPKTLVEASGKLATRLCQEKYGTSPRLKIDGHTNAQFIYLPLPLEYILPELLKNSFRATVEHHRASSSLPDVNVTIAVNEKDFVVRIRDRGGGIQHSLLDKVFDYHFSTAQESNNKSGDSAATAAMDNMSESFDISMDTGMGMICEASASRGLAVMHGYGFGLPTSKAYAEYLGGSLTFQSMQGIGSDFYLRLGLLDVEHETVRI